jgi:transposase
MSVLAMTAEQRAELETAQRQSRNVRHWKRYQAVLLRAEGTSVAIVAQTLGCSQASVSNWTTEWREAGVAGVREGVHPGAVRRLDAAGEQWLAELLSSDPQAAGHAATGWTVPLLQTELATGGWRARTIRRTLHRLGLETAALRAGPARSRLRGQKGAVAEQVGVTVEAGGEVWFGDETTLREYPPLHAAWAKRGKPANVVISGRNGRRVLHGALNAATGAFVHLLREPGRLSGLRRGLGPRAA